MTICGGCRRICPRHARRRPSSAAFAARLAGDAEARAAVAAWRERLEPLLGTRARGDAAGVGCGPASRRGSRPGRRPTTSASRRCVARAGDRRLAAGGARRHAGAAATAAGADRAAAGAGAGRRLCRGGDRRRAPSRRCSSRSTRRPARAVVRAIGLTPPAKKSLELWYIGPGRDPRSLGLVCGRHARGDAAGRRWREGDRPRRGLFAVTGRARGRRAGGRADRARSSIRASRWRCRAPEGRRQRS